MEPEKTRRITYDLDAGDPAPEADQFLVTLTKAGAVSTLYHIAQVRLVNSRRPGQRFALDVYVADDLKPHAVVRPDGVYVRGSKAWRLCWYPRDKKPTLHPLAVTVGQVLGDFVARHTCGAAVLLARRGGEVYHYAQWTDLTGAQHALGWCQFHDEAAFRQAWEAPMSGTWAEPVPTPYRLPATCSAEQVVRAYRKQVEAETVVLLYHGPGWVAESWACWHDDHQAWVEGLWRAAAGRVQALWDRTQLPFDRFSAATYAEALARIGHEQRWMYRQATGE